MSATLDTALMAKLVESTSVAARMGTRIYPAFAPQSSVMPYAVYKSISTDEEFYQQGSSDCPETTVQIDIYAATYGEVKAAASEIRAALNGFQGDITVGASTFRFISIEKAREFDDSVLPGDGSGKGIYRLTADYRCQYYG